jgi:hypothetical protein
MERVKMGFDFLDISFIIMIFISAGMYLGKKDFEQRQKLLKKQNDQKVIKK